MFRILLIEDSEGDILLMRDALEEVNNNIELIVIKDGEKALEYIEEINVTKAKDKVPNIILLDINLPKISGHDILVKIKQIILFDAAPVIMFTTSSSVSDINKAYNNKVNCFITKPNDLNQFYKFVRSINNFWLNVANLSS